MELVNELMKRMSGVLRTRKSFAARDGTPDARLSRGPLKTSSGWRWSPARRVLLL